MYIRKSTRSYKRRTYTNYLLVESVHTPKGPRQNTICSLGDLSPRPREEWLKLACKIEEALVGQGDLLERIMNADQQSDSLMSLEIAPRKKYLRTGRPKEIITPLPAAASRSDRRQPFSSRLSRDMVFDGEGKRFSVG